MSKIGKKPILIPEGVTLTREGDILQITGKSGVLSIPMLSGIHFEINEQHITLTPTQSNKQSRSNWGTMASLIKNSIIGVTEGYTKKLEIEGVGFKVAMEGSSLILNVGFSHAVKVEPLEGVTIQTEKNSITVSGINKQIVGEMAAKIRRIKKPEPYKGKGIHYVGEVIRRKAGKKVAGSGE